MLRILLVLVIGAFVLNSCGPSDLVSQLGGKEWNVTSILGKTLDANESMKGLPSVNFGENGKLFGSTGCNNFNGSFKLDGTSLTLDPGAITKMFCPDSYEQDFLSAVKQVTNVKIDGSTLNLLNGTNPVMTLVPKVK
ncbi:MAG: META domain-containing protein [Ignavibacterium sp.]|nr:META domain-containing protein [Ignavibacterium sp.]